MQCRHMCVCVPMHSATSVEIMGAGTSWSWRQCPAIPISSVGGQRERERERERERVIHGREESKVLVQGKGGKATLGGSQAWPRKKRKKNGRTWRRSTVDALSRSLACVSLLWEKEEGEGIRKEIENESSGCALCCCLSPLPASSLSFGSFGQTHTQTRQTARDSGTLTASFIHYCKASIRGSGEAKMQYTERGLFIPRHRVDAHTLSPSSFLHIPFLSTDLRRASPVSSPPTPTHKNRCCSRYTEATYVVSAGRGYQ